MQCKNECASTCWPLFYSKATVVRLKPQWENYGQKWSYLGKDDVDTQVIVQTLLKKQNKRDLLTWTTVLGLKHCFSHVDCEYTLSTGQLKFKSFFFFFNQNCYRIDKVKKTGKLVVIMLMTELESIPTPTWEIFVTKLIIHLCFVCIHRYKWMSVWQSLYKWTLWKYWGVFQMYLWPRFQTLCIRGSVWR